MIISIETAYNVTIDYDVASVGDRIVAAIIDVVIQAGYVLALFLLIDAMNLSPEWPTILILLAPAFLYDLLCEIFLEGQSFGKKARRLKVVKVDGSEPTLGSYLLRWMLRIVDSGVSYVGVIIIAISGKGQRLGDMAAGTTVIKLRSRLELSETLLPELGEVYVPTYVNVTRLSDRDVALIRDLWAAGRRQTSNSTLHALAARVAKLIGAPPPGNSETFLHTVVKDYTYLTQGDEVI
jgi:uncharacterized RDD family membrane protein YckC